jgi:rfaE bifunctional protein kinase chain/domain
MIDDISRSNLADIVNRFGNNKIVVVGDVMIDENIYTTVDRICPEAPVPVADFKSRKYILGGAANVASNVKSLGGDVTLFGVCGDDDDRIILQNLLEDKSIGCGLTLFRGKQTTKKTRIFAMDKLLLRVDTEDSKIDLDAHSRFFEKIVSFVEKYRDIKYLIISDYNKGVFTFSKLLCRQFISTMDTLGVRVLVDSKPQNFDNFKGAFLFKPNKKEILTFMNLPLDHSTDYVNILESFSDRLNTKNILLTLAEQGSILYTNKHIKKLNTIDIQKVYDVTGAGDTVISALAMALSCTDCDIESASVIANVAAGLSVQKLGVCSITKEELLSYIL